MENINRLLNISYFKYFSKGLKPAILLLFHRFSTLCCLVFFIFLIHSCQKPYGHKEIISENLPDSIEYPEFLEIQDTDDSFQYYRLAKYTYDQGDLRKALDHAKKAIQLDDENALYYYLVAQIYASLEENNEALDNALKSYSLGYVNPELQILISQQYYAKEEIEKSREFLNVVLRKKPNDPSVTFLKARMLLQDHDTVSAIDWINKTLSIDSTYTEAMERKAEIEIAGDNLEEAIRIRERIYQINPENITNMYTVGTLQLELKNYDEATKWFKEVIKKDSTHLSSYLQLAEIKLENYQYDSSRFYSEIALQYDSAFNDARLIIARSYDKQYMYSRALEVYQNILARDSTFEIATIEMEQLLKKIAYLRRIQQRQDSVKQNMPAPIQGIKDIDNQ